MQRLRKIGDMMKIKREYTDLSLEGSAFIMKYRHIFVTLIFLMQAALANYLAFIIRFDGGTFN